jgi:hypothetical protein
MLGDDVVWTYTHIYKTKFLAMEYFELPSISTRFIYIPKKSAHSTSGLLLGPTARYLSS